MQISRRYLCERSDYDNRRRAGVRFALNTMNCFSLNTMNLVLIMMDSVLKMMDFAFVPLRS